MSPRTADALEGKGMSRRTLNKGLKALVEMGLLERRRERVAGRTWPFYVFSSEEVRRIFGEMRSQLQAVTGELYGPVAHSGLDPGDRGKALIRCVEELLRYHRSLTLMTVKLAVQAPNPETAVRRFIKLLSRFTDMPAGGAVAACWLNRDIAEDVFDAMLGPLPCRAEEEAYVEASRHE